ncbi:hypothetical protein BDR26DRAFT_417082 [Obelidium mucronatum]|nr:hypothetical protein BDR26DRAFT_417082 [Obelidium mucronatum]
MAQTLAKTKLNLESSDRTNKALSAKVAVQESIIKDMTAKTNLAKEEATKAVTNLHTALSQFKHKSKRREADYVMLQERLQKLTSDQLHSAKLGIRIVNPSKKKLSAPIKSKPANHEKDLYVFAIASLEEREKELLVELNALKSTLYSTYASIKQAVKTVNHVTGIEDTDSVLSYEPHEEARFHLPFSLVKSQIEDQFQFLLGRVQGFSSMIADAMKQRTQQSSTESDDAIQRLHDEIAEYRDIVEKQKILIEMALETQVSEVGKTGQETGNAGADEADFLSDLDEQRNMIARRSEQLDEERRKFTEAAIRLGRERCAFEREKEDFEEQKRTLTTQHILEQMPDTPVILFRQMAQEQWGLHL